MRKCARPAREEKPKSRQRPQPPRAGARAGPPAEGAAQQRGPHPGGRGGAGRAIGAGPPGGGPPGLTSVPAPSALARPRCLHAPRGQSERTRRPPAGPAAGPFLPARPARAAGGARPRLGSVHRALRTGPGRDSAQSRSLGTAGWGGEPGRAEVPRGRMYRGSRSAGFLICPLDGPLGCSSLLRQSVRKHSCRGLAGSPIEACWSSSPSAPAALDAVSLFSVGHPVRMH
ncbi:translation initiation factor IF-2-like [Mustela putorius furo]|uniref:Translation initiation factor IF-2-like n=1 Tax=Mustela putorius furo TaxID=9669 RepID=A0A8U0SAN3_MUSPF|nr:translation initiation factor IF-2-like [Mustela putorius furo]